MLNTITRYMENNGEQIELGSSLGKQKELARKKSAAPINLSANPYFGNCLNLLKYYEKGKPDIFLYLPYTYVRKTMKPCYYNQGDTKENMVENEYRWYTVQLTQSYLLRLSFL